MMQITPLINDKAADFVQELIDDALEKGGKLLIGNKRDKRYIWNTVFDNVTQDRLYGKNLLICFANYSCKKYRRSNWWSNRSEYGLQGCVFKNIDKALLLHRS